MIRPRPVVEALPAGRRSLAKPFALNELLARRLLGLPIMGRGWVW